MHPSVFRKYGGENYIQANALRIDFVPTPRVEFVRETVNRLMGLLRWWTRQWWVTQDEKFLAPPDATALNITKEGLVVGPGFGAVNLPIAIGIERVLDYESFASACYFLEQGKFIPYSYDLWFDAIYFHALRNRRRFVMNAALACDAAILEKTQEVADRKGVAVKLVENRLDRQDLLYNLDKGLSDIVGASFAKELPNEFQHLKRLWKARGQVAHGREPQVPEIAGLRPLALAEHVEIIDAIHDLFAWLGEK